MPRPRGRSSKRLRLDLITSSLFTQTKPSALTDANSEIFENWIGPGDIEPTLPNIVDECFEKLSVWWFGLPNWNFISYCNDFLKSFRQNRDVLHSFFEKVESYKSILEQRKTHQASTFENSWFQKKTLISH